MPCTSMSMSHHVVARLRALTCASVLLAALACNTEDAAGPVGEADLPADATPAVESPATLTPEMLTSATAPGIPFGDFHLPYSLFSNTLYSGSLQRAYTSNIYDMLNNARSNSERVVLAIAGPKEYYKNSDGTFNLTKWKSRVAIFKGYNLAQYVTSGTLLGHYLVDEPFCTGCWGGKAIPYSQIEEMSKYSKSLWPSLPTAVRAPPTTLGTSPYSSLDFAWAQWEGPLHFPSRGLSAQQFRDREVARAQQLHLGLVFGMNYLDGGNGTSHINGTYYQDPNLSDNVYCKSNGSCYRYAMSASEVKSVGSVFAAASYGCAVLSWKYNSTFISRSGMKDAMSYVSNVAKNRSRSSCVK
jgi:hypothetical protein